MADSAEEVEAVAELGPPPPKRAETRPDEEKKPSTGCGGSEFVGAGLTAAETESLTDSSP